MPSWVSDSQSSIDTALTKDKPQPEFWIGIADLYRDTGLAAKSKISDIKTGIIAALDKANALKPESPLTIHRLADYYKLWGENEKAIRLFVSLIELSPSLVGVREQLAELYLREEKTKDATKNSKPSSAPGPPTSAPCLSSAASSATSTNSTRRRRTSRLS